jgi:hypothetical protein
MIVGNVPSRARERVCAPGSRPPRAISSPGVEKLDALGHVAERNEHRLETLDPRTRPSRNALHRQRRARRQTTSVDALAAYFLAYAEDAEQRLAG